MNGRICGRLEYALAVAALTPIFIWFTRKLGFMDVLMTCGAGEIPKAINHYSFGIRSMAFDAWNCDVAFLKRKFCFVVLGHSVG